MFEEYNSLLVILFSSCFITAAISAIIGMAGGVALLGVMTFFYPHNIIVPLHGLAQLISNGSRTLLLLKNVYWPIVAWYAAAIPFGAIISYFLIKEINHPEKFQILIAFLIFYVVFKPKKLPNLKLKNYQFLFVGFFDGIIAPLIGASGPLKAVFFVRDDFTKEEIVSTKACTQILSHLIKMPIFIALAFPFMNYIKEISTMAVGVLMGTYIGVKILHKVNQKIFMLLFKSALILAALRILYKNLL